MAIGAYTLELVHWGGSSWTVDATLTPNAVITEMSWELNGLGTMSFTIPTNDANASAIQPLTREVRVKRNGTIVWWGVVLRTDVGYQELTVQCERLFYYYTRRYFGVKAKNNLILNGSFESFTGTPDIKAVSAWANWTGVNMSADAVSTHQFLADGEDPTTTHYGINCAQNTANAEAYIFQRFDISTGSQSSKFTFWAVAHQRADTYQSGLTPQEFAPAFDGRGMLVLRAKLPKSNYGSSGVGMADLAVDKGDQSALWKWSPETGASMGKTDQGYVTMTVPPNTTGCFEVRLYVPKGDIVWDNIRAYSDDAFSYAHTKVGDIINAINTLAQSTDEGKSDLHISFSGTNTGRYASFGTKYSEHKTVADAIQSFVRMSGVGDFDIDDATRTLTYYASGKGSYKSGYPIVLGTHITDFSYNDDGTDSANSVIAVSDADTFTRDEAIARDVASTFGGNVFEHIIQGGPLDTPDSLSMQARKYLANSKALVRALTVSLLPDQQNHIDNILVGDTVPVTLARGYVNLSSAQWRVVKKSVNPVNDVMTLTLNPPPAA
jgi:hypothetical protein